jgi:hypothetical protein
MGTDKLCGDGEMFKGLVSLMSLSICRFKDLHIVECGAFKHLSEKLLYLSMMHNSIVTIEQGAFKCLNKLKEFRFINNNNVYIQDLLRDLKNNEEFRHNIIFA